MEHQDPMIDPQIIPQLYAKIGMMQVKIEMLVQDNQFLQMSLGSAQARIEELTSSETEFFEIQPD